MRARISIVLVAVAAALTFISCASPDTVITTKLKAKMMADEVVRPYTVEVETHNGVVTVTGNINSQDAHDRILQLARETKGVTNVVDMISVKTAAGEGNAPEPGRTVGEHLDDAAITAKVKSKLLDDPQVKGLKIDVDTRDGVVFLTGSVRSDNEKETAIQLARGTKGVRDVQANLTISSI